MFKDINKLLLSLGFGFLLIFIFQILYYVANPYYFEDNAPSEYISFQRNITENTPILFFGDSTLVWVNRNKDGLKPLVLPDILSKTASQSGIGVISYPAYSPGIYKEYANNIKGTSYRPKLVILQVSMRSFSPERDLRPEYQFENASLYLKYGNNQFFKLFSKPISNFNNSNAGSLGEIVFEQTKIYDGDKFVGSAKDFLSKKDYASAFIFEYMTPIPDNHRKLVALIDTINIYKSLNIPILIYINPLDYEAASKYLGEKFIKQVDKNAQLVINKVKNEGIDILDLRYLSPAEDFDWEDVKYPNEHQLTSGRKKVAQALANWIITWRKSYGGRN